MYVSADRLHASLSQIFSRVLFLLNLLRIVLDTSVSKLLTRQISRTTPHDVHPEIIYGGSQLLSPDIGTVSSCSWR